jgi:hypothetical protein
MRVCCRCHKEPELFDPIEQGNKNVYWMVIPKNNPEDPSHLMSSGELMFALSDERDPADDGENDFMCINCFDTLYSEQGDDE